MFYISEDPRAPFVRVRDGYVVQNSLVTFFPFDVYTFRNEKITIERHHQGWYTLTIDDTHQKRYVLPQYVLYAIDDLAYTQPIIATKWRRNKYDTSHVTQLPRCWTFQPKGSDAETFLVGRVTAAEYARLQDAGWSVTQTLLADDGETWVCTYGIAHELMIAVKGEYRAPLSIFHLLKRWDLLYAPQRYLWR